MNSDANIKIPFYQHHGQHPFKGFLTEDDKVGIWPGLVFVPSLFGTPYSLSPKWNSSVLLDPVADGDMTFGPRENGTYYVELTGTDRDLVRVNGQVLKAFNATDAKVVAPSGVVVDPTHRYIPIFSVLSDGRITQHTYGNLTFLQLFKDTTIIDDGIGDPPITPGSDSSSSDSASDDDGIIIVDPPDGDGDGSSSSESV